MSDAASVVSDCKVMKVKLICVLCLFSIFLPLYKISIFHLKMTEGGESEGTGAGEVETHFGGELIEGACLIFTVAFLLWAEGITQHLNQMNWPIQELQKKHV